MGRWIPMEDGSEVWIEDETLPIDQHHPEADKFGRDKIFVTDEEKARRARE